MGENRDKTVDKHPHFETAEDVLAYLNAESERQIHSWGDLYAGMKALIATYRANPCQHTADYLVFVMHCWVLALEDMPEEGDALVIAKKMNEIMALGSDRTGVAFMVGDALRAREQEEHQRAEMALKSLKS